MKHTDVEILQERDEYQGFFTMKSYQLRYRRFAGDWSGLVRRELMVRPRVAAALPYDPKLDQVVLVEQFRLGALDDPRSPWLLELVAGVAEPEESMEALARRELQEEAGLVAQELIRIAEYWVSPGGSNERVTLYCAGVDARAAGGIHGVAAEQEDILVHVVSAEQAFRWVEEGRIDNATTMLAIQWLQLHHRELRDG